MVRPMSCKRNQRRLKIYIFSVHFTHFLRNCCKSCTGTHWEHASVTPSGEAAIKVGVLPPLGLFLCGLGTYDVSVKLYVARVIWFLLT